MGEVGGDYSGCYNNHWLNVGSCLAIVRLMAVACFCVCALGKETEAVTEGGGGEGREGESHLSESGKLGQLCWIRVLFALSGVWRAGVLTV